jgi:dipeptidyl aminopeptidase/acylaminoacyl peptidase
MRPTAIASRELLALVLLTAGALAASTPAQAGTDPPTLERIMADPDWIGSPVQAGYWSADGRAVYYSARRSGSPLVDLHRVDLAGGRDVVVDAKAMAAADGPAVYDRSGRRSAFVRNGDVFLRNLDSGRLTQLTRTRQQATEPKFSSDGRLLSFRVGPDWLIHDLDTALTSPVASVLPEKDPEAPPGPDDLRDLQLRTFSTLRKLHTDAESLRRHGTEAAREDATRAPPPFYLGDEVTILATSLSPDGHWLAVVTTAKGAKAGPKAASGDGADSKLTRYVTESGYEEFETERPRVGRSPPATQSLWLLDLVRHEVHPIAIDTLPGIDDDPLQAVRAENSLPDPKDKVRRGVLIKSVDEDDGLQGLRWNSDATGLAVQLRAIDHKDQWLATVDFTSFALVNQHRGSDPAWTSWAFNDFGWLNDNRTVWYESEESGYGHLYTKAPDLPPRALTAGAFEVSAPALSDDGRWFYVLSNAEAPYAYDVYRVPSTGGGLQRVSRLEGVESFALDHGGRQLLITHSSSYIPSQLALQRADGSGAARELTDTRTALYRSLSWIAPEIVKVPSSHGAGVIYAKLYRPPGTAAPGTHPGVVFVHGAGYTQDVHLRFPYYFREQMFHNLLVRKGYVVIDLDYRASQGYGRDWRTAIYRQMGHPELEDLLDGKQWLVEHAGVDAKRVGIYGGSYGGFMTLMALFRAPGEFAAGAAMRPVTDWMQYDEEYTAAILNEPQVDPIAYARSSPIEFAAGLQDPLLICHGVIDDNVLFEDSMRLYQRLIELHKNDFSISPYPLDRHAFTNADSWLDEYKRIDRLFDTHLHP